MIILDFLTAEHSEEIKLKTAKMPKALQEMLGMNNYSPNSKKQNITEEEILEASKKHTRVNIKKVIDELNMDDTMTSRRYIKKILSKYNINITLEKK